MTLGPCAKETRGEDWEEEEEEEEEVDADFDRGTVKADKYCIMAERVLEIDSQRASMVRMISDLNRL